MTRPRHPGPPQAQRRVVAVSSLRETTLRLDAGIPLHRALVRAFAAADCDSGWLRLRGVGVLRLAYVLPAASDGHHAAWYSEPQSLTAPGRILDAGLVWGRRDGAGFAHCHGLWAEAGGEPAMGHLLAAETVLERAAEVRAWLLPEARFDAAPDPETGFTLFQPVQTAPARAPQAALLRVAPGEDLPGAVTAAMRDLGWRAATVEGLGSLEMVHLTDGRSMQSEATEILVTAGTATPDASRMEVEVVGLGGTRLGGRLEPGANPVLITAELVLRAC